MEGEGKVRASVIRYSASKCPSLFAPPSCWQSSPMAGTRPPRVSVVGQLVMRQPGLRLWVEDEADAQCTLRGGHELVDRPCTALV